jgi:hypothetical protein
MMKKETERNMPVAEEKRQILRRLLSISKQHSETSPIS